MTSENRWTPARVIAATDDDARQFFFVSEHESGVFRADGISDGTWAIRPVVATDKAIPNVSAVILGESILENADIWTLCSLLTAMGATVSDTLGVPK